jgi:predicted DCC family thiol-disulfide oxidoreductase YuxK
LLQQYQLPKESFKSFILIDNGEVYQKSTAVLKIFNRLPWYWKELQVLRIVPPLLRNAIYDFIAANRYKWFGKKEQCMVPTPEVKSRFLN